MKRTDNEFDEAKIGGTLDGRYRLEREIARGGMGLVFLAEHVATGQRVAVKVLGRSHLALAEAHARLLREARVLGALRHPNVVRVQDAGTCPKHGPYLALELIEGRPLDGILVTRHVLPIDQAVAMLLQLASALDEVHRRGIVHRDLKPANVLISHTAIGDQVELIDFGVAKILADTDDAHIETEKLTQMGDMLGTREYMSPEQLLNEAIDVRTDVYGAAAVLYECLGGEAPYTGSLSNIMMQVLQKTRPAPLRNKRPEVPRELEAVIAKGLELDPANRWPTVGALARECEAALGRPAPRLQLLELRADAAAPSPVVLADKRENQPTLNERAGRRRQYARAPYVAPARITLANGTVRDGRTEDISEGGVLVVAHGAIPQGELAKVRLPLPDTGRVVELSGVIRWVKERRNVFAVGFEFEELSDEVRIALRAYVALMSSASS